MVERTSTQAVDEPDLLARRHAASPARALATSARTRRPVTGQLRRRTGARRAVAERLRRTVGRLAARDAGPGDRARVRTAAVNSRAAVGLQRARRLRLRLVGTQAERGTAVIVNFALVRRATVALLAPLDHRVAAVRLRTPYQTVRVPSVGDHPRHGLPRARREHPVVRLVHARGRVRGHEVAAVQRVLGRHAVGTVGPVLVVAGAERVTKLVRDGQRRHGVGESSAGVELRHDERVETVRAGG